jgi:response regulator RpfG family c-di-GMP phosphodiesterase
MATSDRFNILVVDPDGASRNKLKQAAMALTTFNKVHIASSLDEALGKAATGESIDVLVLSYRFKEEDISSFVSNAKQSAAGKDWAYITVLKANDQRNEVIADSVISGIDGFLFEPYSADNLREMAEITAKVKSQNEQNRKRAAMMMIVKDISEHLDAVSFYRSQSRDASSAMKKLRDACKRLEKFDQAGRAAYVDVAINFFGNVPPPMNTRYNGVSVRVKKRLTARVGRDLDEKYKD